MPGTINTTVAALVVEGLKAFAPEALRGAEDLLPLPTRAGGVPLEDYRQVLEHAYHHGGGRSLLVAGRALEALSDPLLFVLLNTDAPRLLIEKEARLGRFIHSRHRVQILDESERHLTLEHVGLRGHDPSPLENLAACGQHAVLFEQIGCVGLSCRLTRVATPTEVDGGAIYADGTFAEPPLTLPDDGDLWTLPPARHGFHVWHFAWEEFVPSRRPMAGLDDMLLAASPYKELAEDAPVTARVAEVLLSDLGRTWRITQVARKLAVSPRSLQRALSEAGTTYSDLVDRVRTEEASRLLKGTELSATEIGYICGFADAAHFTRRFKQRYGCPPSRFRAATPA
ncbi:MAG: helix-turn-helix transcriptional regulator [Deltaproteobacteria bacterium]|nr:helix-turn-helix transcriptional regulator [Deltaproteobacteria bacterium]